ncbi:MAG: hypothetical protein ABWK01_06935 [Infirmifilum sp.]
MGEGVKKYKLLDVIDLRFNFDEPFPLHRFPLEYLPEEWREVANTGWPDELDNAILIKEDGEEVEALWYFESSNIVAYGIGRDGKMYLLDVWVPDPSTTYSYADFIIYILEPVSE